MLTEQHIRQSIERELAEAIERVRLAGPDRVVIDGRGTALPPSEARALGIIPRFVFVRNDGWCLGCPASLEWAAMKQWLGFWSARYDLERIEVLRLDDEIPF